MGSERERLAGSLLWSPGHDGDQLSIFITFIKKVEFKS